MIELSMKIEGFYHKQDKQFYIRQNDKIKLIETSDLPKQCENNIERVILGTELRLIQIPKKVSEFFDIKSNDEKPKNQTLTLKCIWKTEKGEVLGASMDKTVYLLSPNLNSFYSDINYQNLINGAKGFNGSYYVFPKGRTVISDTFKKTEIQIIKEIRY